jgi:Contractile injection system tube protein
MASVGKIKVVQNRHSKPPHEIEFTFNPSKIKITGGSNWDQPSASGAKKATPAQFKGANPRTMDLELTLEGWELTGPGRTKSYDVVKAVEALLSWTQPTDSTRGSKKPTAPIVKLVWGTTQWFQCYLASVNATYTMFTDAGVPVRASVTLSMKELPEPGKKQNPTSGSRVGHQTHLLVEGDSLASLAHRYYEEAPLWRGLAVVNNIDDPTRLRIGSNVSLPPFDELKAMMNSLAGPDSDGLTDAIAAGLN